jgi:hypothetical protein
MHTHIHTHKYILTHTYTHTLTHTKVWEHAFQDQLRVDPQVCITIIDTMYHNNRHNVSQ